MPIVKQLPPNGTLPSKRRSRQDLTRDMISAPLGDFRHTMHVGRGGEAFGDTSFLSNHGPSRERDCEPPPREGEGAGPPPGGATELPGDCDGGRRPAGEGICPPPPGGMRHAESVLSFHLDLGPSMLSEVLGVMEKGTEPRDRPGIERPSLLVGEGEREEDKREEEGDKGQRVREEDKREEEGDKGQGDEEGDKEEEEGGTDTFEEEEDDEIHM